MPRNVQQARRVYDAVNSTMEQKSIVEKAVEEKAAEENPIMEV